MNGALKSKTLWFAMLLAAFGVVEMQAHLFRELMPPWGFGLFSVGVSVAVAVLRVVTTMPLSDK